MADINNQKMIAVIEDEEDLLDLYVNVLENEGYKVDQAKNGEEGLELLTKDGYDLVLLDIMLPKMDAFQILNELKKNKAKTQDFSKIVLLTNLSQESVMKQTKELKLKNYLIKCDYNPSEFISKINEFLKSN